MYHSEAIKVEYGSKWPAALCHACLSAERALSPLGTLVDMYRKICDINILNAQTEVPLCWECIAVLKRAKRFKDRVTKAQSVLQLLHNYKETPQTLSTLNPSVVDTNTYIEDHKEIQNVELESKSLLEVDETKYEINIAIDKHEIEVEKVIVKKELNDDDIYDNFEYKSEDIKPEDIARESTKKKRKFRETYRKQYRKVYYPAKDVAVQKKIEPTDLNSWLAKERSSPYFLSLRNKCEKCIRWIKMTDSLEEHNKLYHSKSAGRYICDICQRHFAQKSSLVVHISSHYFSYSCSICGYQCYTARQIYWHIQSHGKTVQCIQCEAYYSNAREFYSHYKSLHTRFICDKCGKQCAAKRVLEKHMRHHDTAECKVCNKKFNSWLSLDAHKQWKHAANAGEAAFCVRCNRQFDRIVQYQRHVRTSAAHADEREKPKSHPTKWACAACGKQYSRKTYMMNHYRHVHTNQTRHYCVDCDRSFLNSSKYIHHRKFFHEGHVKKKNKICSVCGRAFADNHVLENHMRTHTGERPFACTYCDSKFAQRTAMLTHVKTIHLKCKRKTTEHI